MFVNDIFSKKLNESLRSGEYYVYRVYFDDGTSTEIKVRSDEYDFKSHFAKQGKNVVKVEQQGGIRSEFDEGFAELDAYMAAQRAPKPKGGAGVKHGVYGTPERKRGRGRGPTGGSGSAAPSNRDFGRPRSVPRAAPMGIDDYDANYRREVDEGSVQDRLHRRHQELRKKSGLPDPDYYRELKASYDIEDDAKRLAQQAEIKKKYGVAEGLPQTLRKVVPGYAKREIDKKMDAGKFGKTDADKDANYYRYKKIQDKLKEQGVAEAGPFSYGAKKPRKGSVAYNAMMKRKEQEKNKKPIEPKDQMVGTARVIKDVSEDFDDMSPHTSYVQSKRTVTSVNGKDHLSDRTASLSTDKSGNHRVRAVDGDKITIDTNIPKGVNVKMIPQITNEDVEQYLEEMRCAGYDIITERATLCPECGGPAYEDKMLAEKQDACYHKVKSRYKVWPSAYASGALVRCRKVGAKNWGNKSKK
jgi:hypothetical protein